MTELHENEIASGQWTSEKRQLKSCTVKSHIRFGLVLFPDIQLFNQLIELYNKILIPLSKQVTSITFADMSKAFDTAWMNALLYKLEKNGINGELLCC